jgi:hypothetical protein
VGGGDISQSHWGRNMKRGKLKKIKTEKGRKTKDKGKI